MAEQNVPNRQGSLINVVGINTPDLPIASVNAPQAAKLQDVTNEKFSQVNQDVQRGYQAQIGALQSMSQTYAKVRETQGQSKSKSQLGGIVDSLASTWSEYQKSQAAAKQQAFDNNIKARAQGLDETKFAYSAQQEQVKSEQDLVAGTVQGQLTDELTNLQDNIQQLGETDGIHTTRANVDAIFNAVEGKLPASVLAPMRALAYQAITDAQEKQTTRVFEAQESIRTNRNASIISTVQLNISPGLSALTQPNTTTEQANTIIGNAMRTVTQQTEGLDLRDRLEILVPTLATIAKSAGEGSVARTVIGSKLNAIAEFRAWYLSPEGGGALMANPSALATAALAKATSLGVPELATNVYAPNNNNILDDATKAQANIDAINKSNTNQQNQALANGNNEYASNRAATIAFSWFNPGDPQAANQYYQAKATPEADRNPIFRAAMARYEDWTQRVTRYQGLQKELDAAVSDGQRVYISQLNVGNIDYIDTPSGRAQRVNVQDGQGGTLFAIQGATQVQVEAAANRVRTIREQINTEIRNARGTGLDVTNPSNGAYIDQMNEKALAQEQAAASLPALQTLAGISNAPPQTSRPNFNGAQGSGYPAAPPVTSLAKDENGNVAPVAAGSQVVITSHYGNREHPVHGGTRFHTGEDITTSEDYTRDVGALTIQGGTVLDASDANDGFGGTVMVRTPDGRTEQYSHLRRFFVKPGDTIPPGTPIGVVGGGEGDPMAGSSTGRHIHFTVWRAGVEGYGDPQNNTIDPAEYRASIMYNESVPPGIGLPPTSARTPTNYLGSLPSNVQSMLVAMGYNENAQGATPLSQIGVLQNGQTTPSPVTQTYGATNPVPNVNAPIDRSAYPERNDPGANYGYGVIAHDPDFAKALAEVGDQLNIPAQWLADIMYAESGLDPHIDNHQDDGGWGHGYLGLIQINGDTLREFGYTYDDVMRMSRADYTRKIAKRYLQQFASDLHTIEDVYASIYGGGGLLDQTPSERHHIGDGQSRFSSQIQSFGNSVGRRYRTSYDLQASLPVHTDYCPGCPSCDQMMNRFGAVVPHESIA